MNRAPDTPGDIEASDDVEVRDGIEASDDVEIRGDVEVRELFVYLCVRDAAAAIAFYTSVFGARESFRLAEPGGRVGHAELTFGPATVMLCDEHPEHGILAPPATGCSGTTVHLHVKDVDRLADRAVAAGAVLVREPTDYSHGERQCRLRDPFGHEWLLGHQLEALSNDEIARRYEAEQRST